ncbi:hypothetical protein ACR6C2_20445 [Streptomyces sp. INA 01156]
MRDGTVFFPAVRTNCGPGPRHRPHRARPRPRDRARPVTPSPSPSRSSPPPRRWRPRRWRPRRRVGVDVRTALGVVGALLAWFAVAFVAPAVVALAVGEPRGPSSSADSPWP